MHRRTSFQSSSTPRPNPEAAHRLLGDSSHYAAAGLLDVQWHTDQIRRIAKGRDPDPARPWWRTIATTVRRDGLDAIPRPWGARSVTRGYQ